MADERDLGELGILNWSELAKKFNRADILLGNGFSVNITPRLRYDSLFDKFLTECQPKGKRIFRSFGTTNFEIILQKLSNAKDVNRIFGIETSEIEDSVEGLKDGLVRTIGAVHPRWAETDPVQLERIALELNRFHNVYTLNYDLYLYRIILILKDKRRNDANIGQYSDYFWEGYDDNFLCFDTSKKFEGYRHPYYLHGALFLFKESSYDLKLKKANSNEELMEVIENNIREGRMPLFVSEGTYSQKMEAIGQSTYLRFTLDKLKESESSLVIFGTSLSDPDKHIVDAINRNNRDLAISIHIGTKSKDQLKSIEHYIKSKFPSHKVRFFNSDTLFHFLNIGDSP